MQDTQKTDSSKGAVLRWAIQATDSDRLQLCLLGLPVAEAHIKRKALLRRDSCPAILLGAVKLHADYHTTGIIRGPRPILFSSDPKRTTEHLRQDPSKALPGTTVLIPKR